MTPPSSEANWAAYHHIRRTVLFEARGRVGVYQSDHPDEHAPGNHPFLLFLRAQPIGVIRVDLPEGGTEAIFRRVAIASAFQRHGHGTVLMREAELFAAGRDRSLFVANVALDAVPFYEKIRYRVDPDHTGIDPENPRITKASPTVQ